MELKTKIGYCLAILSMMVMVVAGINWMKCKRAAKEAMKAKQEAVMQKEDDGAIFLFGTIAASYIVEPVQGDTLIVMSPDTPAELLPPIGVKCFVPICEMAPDGLMARVADIDWGKVITIRLRPLPVDEVLNDFQSQLGIDSLDLLELEAELGEDYDDLSLSASSSE